MAGAGRAVSLGSAGHANAQQCEARIWMVCLEAWQAGSGGACHLDHYHDISYDILCDILVKIIREGRSGATRQLGAFDEKGNIVR